MSFKRDKLKVMMMIQTLVKMVTLISILSSEKNLMESKWKKTISIRKLS